MGGPGSGRKPDPYKSTKEERADRNAGKIEYLFAQPRLDTVPDPDFPMGAPGLKKYRELAEMLLKSGQLTVVTKGYAEMAALSHDEIIRRSTADPPKSISANLIQRYQSALANIQLLDVDRNTPGATEQKKNRFRYSGFSSRLR